MDTRFVHRLRGIGVAAAALATLLVPVQVASQLGYPVQALAAPYLTATRQGHVLLLRLAALGAGAATLRGIPGTGLAGQAVQGLLAGAIVITVGLTGHAGVRPDLMVAHALHLGGALTWGGGLAVLASLPDRPGLGPGRVEAIRRFSSVAAGIFPVVLAAGAYLGYSLGGSWKAWPGSSYGRWLMIKALAVILLAAAAAVNRWRRLPLAVRAASDAGQGEAAWRRLRHSVQVEAALLMGVLALTAVLAGQAPPALQARP
ncbi:MAG TPA: CopD family protein [Limnochordales bacterium]